MRTRATKPLVVAGALYLVIAVLMLINGAPVLPTMIAAYTVASIPAGWSIVSALTPRVFLLLPLVGWAVYFGVKAMLAAIVGPFALPFTTYRNLTLVRSATTVENSTTTYR